MSRVVHTQFSRNPSIKDRNEWIAGGYFANAVLAGGTMFAPDRPPGAIGSETQKGTFAGGLLNGNFNMLLNTGYAQVQSIAKGGLLDLITDYTFRSTVVAYYTIRLRTPGGGVVTYANGAISYNEGSSDTAVNTTFSKMSLYEVEAVFNNRRSIADLMSTPGLINIGIDLGYGLKTGTLSTSIGAIVGGLAVGTVQSMVTNQATGIAARALGVTSLAAAAGINYAVGLVVEEVFEMAVGLDNHFGFGGEFVGYDADGTARYSAPVGFAQGMYDTVMEAVTFGAYVSQVELNKAETQLDIELSYMDAYGVATYQIEMELDDILNGKDTSYEDDSSFDWSGAYEQAVADAKRGYANNVNNIAGFELVNPNTGEYNTGGSGGGLTDGFSNDPNEDRTGGWGGFGPDQQNADNPDGFAGGGNNDSNNNSNNNDKGDDKGDGGNDKGSCGGCGCGCDSGY